jgi:cold shock CspA family protein
MRFFILGLVALTASVEAFIAPRIVPRHLATRVMSDEGFSLQGFGEPPDPNQILTGVCKWFDTTKGFGFISPDVGGADVFVHQSVIQAEGFRSLSQGEKVEYKLGLNEKTGKQQASFVSGPEGVNVVGAPNSPFF